MMNEQYNARFVLISPCSAILVMRTMSTRVRSIIAMKITKSMIYIIIPKAGIHKDMSQEKRKTIIDPNKRDNPIIATQEKFPFANKAIKASIPMTIEVIPKATPRILQSMNIVNVESNMPINVM